ncbi:MULTISPECIES: ComEC/Rec2 family competence protein [Bacillus]|uniref:ComEC/Rec2 family competence protein n=1 Tax=Bacillus TaxID=1386 RepID=UPI000BB852DD|nr:MULTISPECIES: hypothetical protein [Bacillus]
MNIFFIVLLAFSFFPNPGIPAEVNRIDLKLQQNEVAFTFLDLVDGESTLIQTYEGETILINTGSEAAKEELDYYLELYGVDNISTLILTSTEPEYVSNVSSLLDEVVVGKIVSPISMESAVKTLNTPIETWESGKTYEISKGLSVTVLHEKVEPESDEGMDLLFSYFDTSILYMTSANKKVEDQIVADYHLEEVDILKVGDFGNKNGTTQPFLNESDPQIAILFKKESKESMIDVLERLHETWIEIIQTKLTGNISIKLKEHDYQVITLTIESLKRLHTSS